MLDGKSQRLWQPDPEIWNRSAPVLFPLIGRLKEKKYEYKEKIYSMPSHGFADTSLFSVEKLSKDSAVLTLTHNDETAKAYPFEFSFSIEFTLTGKTLIKKHTVKNLTNGEMLYELGGHEGYNLNLYENAAMTDYSLVFNHKNFVETFTTDENIMFCKETKQIPLENNRLPLDMSLFKNDALVLKNVSGSKVELLCKNKKTLTVSFPGFDYLGIWTRYKNFDTKYICIEPWTSLPDCNYLGFNLEDKISIRRLSKGQTETLTYSMTFE